MDDLSTTSLLVLAPAVLVLSLVAPPYLLLLLTLTVDFLPGEWIVGGVHLDPTDLLLGGILLAYYARRPASPSGSRIRIPYMRPWLAYGVLVSLAYLAAPGNQDSLTGPINIAYQLYRYCWRPMLFYPLCFLLLSDETKIKHCWIAIIVVADIWAAQALPQGFAGGDASGPFLTKNQLGGALVIPLALSVAGFLYASSRNEKLCFGGSGLLIARALVIAGSRGAFVGGCASVALMLTFLATQRSGMARVIRSATMGLAGLAFLLVLRPDILDRPSVAYLMAATNPNEVDTFQWRKEERWPHFFKMAMDNFWLGVGTDVDPSLGDSCITPHNGYLSVAVIHGTPALLFRLLLLLLAIRAAFGLARSATLPSARALGLGVACALVGTLVHNYVDATMELGEVGRSLWLLSAVVCGPVLRRDALELSDAPTPGPAVASRQDPSFRFRPAQ